ncbi:predicted protein, partial [Thalassiosira pseudonana CCMP1335]
MSTLERRLFQIMSALSSHLKNKHSVHRTKSNLELASDLLFAPISNTESNHWTEGLHWIYNTFDASTPPPFRQSLLLKLQYRLLDQFLDLTADLVEATVEANRIPESHHEARQADFKADPYWSMLLIVEQLVLAPIPTTDGDKPNNESMTQCIYRRIRWFRSGRIRELWEESRKVKSKTPLRLVSERPRDDTVEKSAQIAADNDNFKTAYARLTKDTPVARIDDRLLKHLQQLFPPAVRPSSTTTRSKNRTQNRKKIHFLPSKLIDNILHLKNGKAPGIQVDSLDVFIKLAQRCKRSTAKGTPPLARNLASLFSAVANGEIPESAQHCLRTTYLVALAKDKTDDTKLRPLGIPSAIRRITANAIANDFKSEFAAYLLPYNYAVGVNGGIDFITTTLRIGVEKYIGNQEAVGLMPTRALVSLDIRNMFNAISRHQLRDIVKADFPLLEAFVDSLYEQTGTTRIKMTDGTWRDIAVQEGFSQGCPLSPILAAIVLVHILRQVNTVLKKKAATRQKSDSDDGMGSITTMMAYVDDANFLVPLEDVELLLDTFAKIATPLGAVMNTEKTRILTSIFNQSTLERLKAQSSPTFASLNRAISRYSRKQLHDGTFIPLEVITGLRVLGVPIGSKQFCHQFHEDRLQAAAEEADKLYEGLTDLQTMIRLFKTCTLHKVTHLFSSDVVHAFNGISARPPDWDRWHSTMTDQFSTLLNSFLARVLTTSTIPPHAHVISTISLQNGGLGMQHPRLTAVPSFVFTTKRCIQYAEQGIILPATTSSITLPKTLTSLYKNWRNASSPCTSFRIFQQYAPDIACITRYGTTIDGVDNPITEETLLNSFVSTTSLATAQDTIKRFAGARYITNLEHTEDVSILQALPSILEPHSSLPLVAMSRTNRQDRMDSRSFVVAMKRKLRLELWPSPSTPKCICGSMVDKYGDHFFSCQSFNKTTMSNAIRDGTCKAMKRICVTAQYCNSGDAVDTEKKGVVKTAPLSRPFDWFMDVNHVTAATLKQGTALSTIGFDVIVISPPSPSDLLQYAPLENTTRLLRNGEKGKFMRVKGGTNKLTGHTISPDQLMGDIVDSHHALIPQVVDPWGKWNELFERTLIGDRAAPPVPSYPASRRNAQRMHELACSTRVPFGLLNSANKTWKTSHSDSWYGDSYLAADPKTWALQQIGLTITNALTAHLIAGHDKLTLPSATAKHRQTKPLLSFQVEEELSVLNTIEYNSRFEVGASKKGGGGYDGIQGFECYRTV